MMVISEENQVKVIVFVYVFTGLLARVWLHADENIPVESTVTQESRDEKQSIGRGLVFARSRGMPLV